MCSSRSATVFSVSGAPTVGLVLTSVAAHWRVTSVSGANIKLTPDAWDPYRHAQQHTLVLTREVGVRDGGDDPQEGGEWLRARHRLVPVLRDVGHLCQALITAGWSPLAVVTVRVGGAALILLPWSLGTLGTVGRDPRPPRARRRLRPARHRGRPTRLLRRGPAPGCRRCPAHRVPRDRPGRALDLAAHARHPPRLPLLGVALSIAGLALVLQIFGAAAPDVVGSSGACSPPSAWPGTTCSRPARPRAGRRLCRAGSHGRLRPPVLAGVLGVVPFVVGGDSVVLGGSQLPAWVALAELIVIAAAAAYLMGIAGARRLGSTLASFVGLTEVLFAVLIAWVLLGKPRADPRHRWAAHPRRRRRRADGRDAHRRRAPGDCRRRRPRRPRARGRPRSVTYVTC